MDTKKSLRTLSVLVFVLFVIMIFFKGIHLFYVYTKEYQTLSEQVPIKEYDNEEDSQQVVYDQHIQQTSLVQQGSTPVATNTPIVWEPSLTTPQNTTESSEVQPRKKNTTQKKPLKDVQHKPTTVSMPSPLRALYISSWTAGTPAMLQRILSLIEGTTINAVVIDIKDSTGRISYQPNDKELQRIGSGTKRIPDIASVLKTFHDKNIYVIGRITVFEDPYLSQKYPAYAYTVADTGAIWKNAKGLSWLRPTVPEVWEYIIRIARDAQAVGFDEINLDYVRFPSDGALSEIAERPSTSKERIATMEKFFSTMHTALREESGIMLSADIFGLTMSASDDLGIGQKLEHIVPYVDYVAPMIYPSHFASGTYGYATPATYPYEIITASLSAGIKKMNAMQEPVQKIRPWLQDFSLGASYTESKVRAQITASEKLGLSSWMMWNAANRYTKKAFE